MPELSHVQKLMAKPASGEAVEWRPAFVMEREGAGQAFCVAVRLKDGREAEGFPVSLYLRHKWIDRDAKLERLIWLFSGGAIYVEGHHLKRGLDALEEGKLKRIQEQDSGEIAQINGRNLDVRKPEDKEPVVSRVIISPRLEDVLESDETLSEIAKAIKGVK